MQTNHVLWFFHRQSRRRFIFLSHDWPQVTFCFFCFLFDDRNKRWQVLQIIWSVMQIKTQLLRIVPRTLSFWLFDPVCFVAVLMMELLFLSILRNKDAQILSSLRLYTLLYFFGNALCIFSLKATTKLWSWTVVHLLYQHGPLSSLLCRKAV